MLLGVLGITLGTILTAVLVNWFRDRAASKNGNGYEHLERCRKK
jgi:predicted PurR-regulated permease PerM